MRPVPDATVIRRGDQMHVAVPVRGADGAPVASATYNVSRDLSASIDARIAITLGHPVDGEAERLGILKQRRNISKKDAGLRIIGHSADIAFEPGGLLWIKR